MIASLLFAFQLAAGPDVLVVKAETETAIPLVRAGEGLSLRLDLLAPAIGGVIRSLPDGRTLLTLDKSELRLHEGVPFVQAGAELVPLAASPWSRDGHLYIPLQFVAEVVPRVATGLLYDPLRGELRTFMTAARSQSASPPREGAGSVVASGSTTAGTATPATTASGTTARTGPAVPSRVPDARPAPRPSRKRRVVVDAGHGGPDAGMTGPIGPGKRIREKDITLAIARQLEKALEARGVEVVMTRTKDTLIALSDRGKIANRERGDLFISIHVNAANPRWKNAGAARGFETYFLAEARTEDAKRVEQMENDVVRFETGVNAPKDDPLGFIIRDMAQNEHLRESSDLAATIQDGMARIHPSTDRGVKQAAFRVLVTAYMPAVLVEVGFGTNATEAAFLADPFRQKQLADAIAGATMEYYEHYERRVTQTAP